ncbi:MAG TPA: class I SAM-dependent methyltransferase [Solirubrobacteraceae bacterium]|jgi:SAM-dependent methyltransferase|nr:class I SAM-dependent methyltransferase [Solirubrobacteraceae bacterium]
MSPTIYADQPAEELPAVRAGRLPDRYAYRMQDVLLERLAPLLVEGVRILDVGAGRSPTIPPEDRPAGCIYVGTDISAQELDSAPPGAYDQTVVQDISASPGELRDFDLILTWQVLEHVPNLAAALANLGSALRPGGVLLAQTSGSYAAFAVLARVMPHKLRVWAMARFLGHKEEQKFPTHFDRCTEKAIRSMLAGWSSVEIVTHYRGAPYFSMWGPLRRLYLLYEDAIARRDAVNLGTHYLIIARR